MKRIVNHRIALFCVLAFLIGIVLGVALKESLVLSICIPTIMIIVGIIFYKKPINTIILAMIIFFSMGSLCMSIDIFIRSGKNFDENASIVGRVESVENNYVVLENLTINGEKTSGKANVKLELFEENIGDIITLNGDIVSKEFNYFDFSDMWQYNNKIYYDIYYDNYNIKEGELKIFERIKLKIVTEMDRMSLDNKGIALSLLLGDKSLLSYEDKGWTSGLGLSHIFAVSGLHVGFLMTILIYIMTKCRLKGVLQLIISAVVLLFYAVLTDFSGGVKRAGIMAIIYLLSKLVFRKNDQLTTLALSVFVITFINPRELFNLSFLMSVSAVLGIIMFYKPISQPFKERTKSKLFKKIIDSISITLSANVFLLPICINVFNSVAVYMVVSNLLILPLVTIAFSLIIITAFLSLVYGGFGVLYYVVEYPINAIRWISESLFKLPYTTITTQSLGIITPILLIMIVMLSRFVLLKQNTKVTLSVIFSAIMVVVAFL